MPELTKSEFKKLQEILKVGILRRHAEWLAETRAILDEPLGEENEYDRSMRITKRSRDFFKEAMDMEYGYRKSAILDHICGLYRNGYLNDDDVKDLPESIRPTQSNR